MIIIAESETIHIDVCGAHLAFKAGAGGVFREGYVMGRIFMQDGEERYFPEADVTVTRGEPGTTGHLDRLCGDKNDLPDGLDLHDYLIFHHCPHADVPICICEPELSRVGDYAPKEAEGPVARFQKACHSPTAKLTPVAEP